MIYRLGPRRAVQTRAEEGGAGRPPSVTSGTGSSSTNRTGGYARPVARLASVYPLVTARALARPSRTRCRTRRGRAPSSRSGSATRGGAVSSPRSTSTRPTGVEPSRSSASPRRCPPALVDLALWLADYYGSTPARALALVAPEQREAARRAARSRRRQAALAAEAAPDAALRDAGAGARAHRGAARRRGRQRPPRTARPAAARPRSTSARARRRSRAGAARSSSCPRSR